MNTTTKRLLVHIQLLATVALVFVVPDQVSRAQTNPGSTKWESEIRAFEAADRTSPPPTGAVLFIGSSSIRLWKSLAQDFPGFKVLNRGFGGSQIADSTAFADRIVLPYKPKVIVLYAGDNDIAAGRSPEQVLADFKAFVNKVRGGLPRARIVFLSIKPSPSRWQFVEKIRAANNLVENFCNHEKRLAYIDVFNPMLGRDGSPRAELFGEDKLHMNAKGYALWTSIIRPRLAK
ncbi:MAG TPA: SGNH/GDSL hydrolase family protein [Candidatus Angelobacter sp.]|nr:SGNH/GDSL hydrolase family protein [Candidatus Angelobacter sp.]